MVSASVFPLAVATAALSVPAPESALLVTTMFAARAGLAIASIAMNTKTAATTAATKFLRAQKIPWFLTPLMPIFPSR